MANSRMIGNLGLNIPVINPSTESGKKMTTGGVLKWRAALPMADTGAAAKKLYIALSELKNTAIDPMERFEILELFRHTTKTICTTLKKHYIEQNAPLTKQKLTIANLRQTLLTEMADNYKIALEDLNSKKHRTDDEDRTIIIVICRILYYMDVILLCRYQIYSSIPTDLWHEIHLLYKYAKQKKILEEQVGCELSFNYCTSIIGSYTRIILFAATDPYQWRQKDQYSINKAIDLWAVYPTIYKHDEIPKQTAGLYIIDLDKDLPPIALSFMRDQITESCIALDVTKNVKHIKQILVKMHSNQLKTRIEHAGDAEFSVTIPTLIKLIKIWSQKIVRSTQRVRITANIKIAFGLSAAYYYINGETEFDPHPSYLNTPFSKRTTGAAARPRLDLQIFEIEDEVEDEVEKTEVTTEPSTPSTTEEANEETIKQSAFVMQEETITDPNILYHVYDYTIDNLSTNGFCLRVDDGNFPPFQTGEIVIFKNAENPNNAPWSIGTLRWIKSPDNGIFQMGIELIAPFAKAAGVQMVRDEQPAGLLLRCLVLPEAADSPNQSVLITPTLPIKSNIIFLYLDDGKAIKTTLLKELESTSAYHQYTYSTQESINIQEPKNGDPVKNRDAPQEHKEQHAPNHEREDGKTNTEFDSIWEDL